MKNVKKPYHHSPGEDGFTAEFYKSPGEDGFTAEFYIKFFDILGEDLEAPTMLMKRTNYRSRQYYLRMNPHY